MAEGSLWGKWMGATHGDEYAFVFGYPIRYPEKYSTDDVNLSHRMINIWSDFAKNGQPSTRWPLFDNINQQYVTLNGSATNIIGNKMRDNVCAVFRRAVDM